MTTLATTIDRAPALPRRIALAGLWMLQIPTAAMLFLAGSSKLAGAPHMIGLFDAIGVGQWFRYATGTIEVVAAVMLLVPSIAAFGALLTIPTMIGALGAHVLVVGGSVLVPTLLLISALVVAWARRQQLTRATRHLGRQVADSPGGHITVQAGTQDALPAGSVRFRRALR